MGCGKSKHDVATGNTITRRKSSNAESEKSKDTEAVVETSTNSLLQQQDSENGEAVGDVKDIAENTEILKGGDDEKELDNEMEGGTDAEDGQEEERKLITRESPNHFFSSRKDEEAIEGVVPEGTVKSEYGTPRNPSAKEAEGMLNENVQADDTVEETKPKAEIGEPAEVKEEKVGKAAEMETTNIAAETVITPTIKEEKVTKVDEHLADSPSKDLKTN